MFDKFEVFERKKKNSVKDCDFWKFIIYVRGGRSDYAPGPKDPSYGTDYYTRTGSCRYCKAHITVENVRPIDV